MLQISWPRKAGNRGTGSGDRPMDETPPEPWGVRAGGRSTQNPDSTVAQSGSSWGL